MIYKNLNTIDYFTPIIDYFSPHSFFYFRIKCNRQLIKVKVINRTNKKLYKNIRNNKMTQETNNKKKQKSN